MINHVAVGARPQQAENGVKAGDSKQEESLASVEIAKATTSGKDHGKGQDISGNHQLDLGETGVEVVLNSKERPH